MKKIAIGLMAVFCLAVSAYAGEVKVKIDTKQLTEIPNAVQAGENLVLGGKPTARGLGQAAEQGIRTVIDVRDPKEGTAEESDYANAVGLRYVNIPITLDHFNTEQADKIGKVLNDPVSGPALLHCASGQRAAAVWALYRNRHEGVSADQAMKEAEEKGLRKTDLESKLRQLLK